VLSIEDKNVTMCVVAVHMIALINRAGCVRMRYKCKQWTCLYLEKNDT